MADPVKILAIAGSLRKASFNKGALRAAQQLLPEGAKMELYDLAGLPLSTRTPRACPTPRSPTSSRGSAPRTRS